MKSVYFSNRALKTFNRFGDILLPKDGDFPSFSEYGGIEHVDKIVAYAPESDISDLNTVFGILSFMPNFVLKFVIILCANAATKNGPIAPLLRQLNMGIRGIIFACYYAERPGKQFNGKDPIDIIGYDMQRVVD